MTGNSFTDRVGALEDRGFMGVTINDVARKAGVSHTTVSWVIHDDRRITAATKEKVWAAIRELNYHPNYSARSLVRGKTNTIAVVAPFFSSPFEMEILRGIELSMDRIELEYEINQYSTRGKREVKEELLSTILYGKRADAVILLSLKPEPELIPEYGKRQVPLVLIEDQAAGVHVIKTDNYRGAYLATKHLIRQGRKRVGLIVGKLAGEEVGLSPRERLQGYRAALREQRVDYREERVLQVARYYFEEGQECLQRLKREGVELDGIFCAAGDLVAMGVIRQAKSLGIRIPEDLAIIGFDDIPFSSIVDPPLSTVRQPLLEMGERAYRLAIRTIQGLVTEPQLICFEPELICRQSG